MQEKQQIDNTRKSLIDKIKAAVEKKNGCIGTFYHNIGERHANCQTEDEYEDSPIVVTHSQDITAYGHFEAATVHDLYIDKWDHRLKCTLNGEAGEDWDEPIENIQTDGLLQIVEWLVGKGFVEKEDPWRCSECGSLDVEYTDTGSGDRNDFWCHNCMEHSWQVKESELMKDIEDWFANHLSPDDDEVISGLSSDEFSTQEEHDAACKEIWDARDNESKIHIWHELTRDKSNDD